MEISAGDVHRMARRDHEQLEAQLIKAARKRAEKAA